MASTYVNALRLNEMGTGDESGNWGVVTNLNLDMIGEAFGYGTEAIADASTHTITMADGAVDEARNFYLKCTGGGQACTVTLAPNTVSKIWIIENATSFTLTFSQGSGANVAVPASDVKVIATDGAGSGAVVHDLFVDLNIATKLTVKNPATSSSPATILLQSGDTDVAAADVLGKVQFQAPDEATGTDAILVAAEIAAVSEGDFSSSNNATKLSFKTAASEAAAEKMSLSSAGNLTVSGDVMCGDDVILDNDGAVVYFGDDQDVYLSHIADSGLTFKNTSTGDDTPVLLLMQTGETDIAADDMLGRIQFQAPDEAAGTDAILVAAEIAAVSEGDFSATSNATKLSFKTGASEAASEKMSLSSGGNLTVSGNVVIADGGTIGSASDTDAIQIRSDGNIGINNTGSDTVKTYIYDNTTTDQLLALHQDHASNNTIALQVTHDGTGTGIYSQKNAGTTEAVYGYNASNGIATRGHSVSGHGVYGATGNASAVGVAGFASNTSHYAYLGYSTHGVYATSAYIAGALYKGSGSFRIPHGLRENYDLVHSFVEGPQCDLIYRGRVNLVNGRATISMDTKYGMTAGTFAWLTKDVQTFTSNETGWDAVKSSFSGDTITIECQNTSSTDTISWMVVAERDDPNIRASELTDSNGDLIIERPSEPEPPQPLATPSPI